MANIIIKYNKSTGKTTVEGEGFQGGECITAIDQLQSLLGMRTVSEEPKDELTYIVGDVDVNQG